MWVAQTPHAIPSSELLLPFIHSFQWGKLQLAAYKKATCLLSSCNLLFWHANWSTHSWWIPRELRCLYSFRLKWFSPAPWHTAVGNSSSSGCYRLSVAQSLMLQGWVEHLVKWFKVWFSNCSDDSSWNIICFVLVEEAVLSLQLIMQLFPTSDLWGFCIQPLLPAHCLVSVPKCSKSCDSGIRTRQVICADGDSKFYSTETCKAVQPQKPATLGSCNTQPCYLPQRECYCCIPSFSQHAFD